MANMTKAERLARVHADALSRFAHVQTAVSDERQQCLQDRRFYSIAGAQWEGELSEQFEHRPKFEVNKVHLAVIRIINEYRNNRITADFVPKAGGDDKLADMCDGLFRADEVDSGAEEAYDNAFEEAVGGGFGAVRLRAVYEDDEDPEDERQRIRIEPVYDADACVFFDLDARRQDKADAKFCFLLSFMTRDAYIAAWNDDPATWPKEVSDSEFDWSTPDQVVVAEYYAVEDASDLSLLFRGPTGDERRVLRSALEADGELAGELAATGYREDMERRKRIKTRRVHKYIMSGGKVLEDCGYIAGKHIPVVPTYGKRWMVDGIERCMGHVRLAKDPQRLKNMQLSKLGELSASSGIEKPIFTPEQVAGHQVMWSEDNIKNYPYLLVNTVTDASGNPMPAGAIGYTKPPAIPPAMAALLQITEQDMQDILGNQQGADKMVSNISGEAVEMIQDRMDMQTYIYVSNFAKTVRRVGEVWLSMARELYVEEGREMKVVGPQDELSSVTLGVPGKDPETGALIAENDLSRAKFDVTVQVGPSSSSRRKATVRALVKMLAVAADPETQKVLSSMVMLNMEGEGVAEAREFYRKQLVQLGVLKPTDEEAAAMAEAQQGPDPQMVLASAMAEEANAKAMKARADAVAIAAEVEKTRAETMEILSGLREKAREAVLKTVQELAQAAQAPNIPPAGPGV
ncbi:MAG: portal protein [Syntrophales bacterium]|jgi:hypothetical protein|nr:portal protein [Syntrophales bacterium]